MPDQLNDIERQFLKRNAKLIQSERYDRAAQSALSATHQFRGVFAQCYKEEGIAKDLFDTIELYLKAIAHLNPYRKKEGI